PEQVARLSSAGQTTPVYPYWHQLQTAADRNPPLVRENLPVRSSAAPGS
ncbi:MAG: aldo/keto reductase, partial [Acidobacteriia bacterium]|nr:aldo/keto reductase [Terriglobia bacterium]